MFLCPTCSREIGEAPVCKCGTELTLLQQIIARADYLFNQALDAYQTGQVARALEYLEANAALVPFDLEARLVQAKLLAQLERWAEVEALVQLIQAVQPAHPELSLLMEILAKVVGENDDRTL